MWKGCKSRGVDHQLLILKELHLQLLDMTSERKLFLKNLIDCVVHITADAIYKLGQLANFCDDLFHLISSRKC